MFSSGVKGLICDTALMQCGRAKVLSATCTSFHLEHGCTKKLVILGGSHLRHSFVYCIVSEYASRSNNRLTAADTNIPGMHILNSALN